MSFSHTLVWSKGAFDMDLARMQAKIARMLEPMKPPLDGGCRCGEVRYHVSALPVWSGHCHCRSCQFLSGAAFVSAFNVPVESFALSGRTMAFMRTAESGHSVTARLCATCGAWITGQSQGNAGLVAVLATTLRDTSVFRAISNVYLIESAPWIEPPPAPFNFPRMPVWSTPEH